SRRRHTRSKRDWSSDVCSSDLAFYRKNSTSYHRNRFTYLPTGSCLFPLVLHNLCTVMWINHCGQMLITWRDFHLMPNPQTVVAHIEYFLLLQSSMHYPYKA